MLAQMMEQTPDRCRIPWASTARCTAFVSYILLAGAISLGESYAAMDSSIDPVRTMGFKPTSLHRSLVESSVSLTNDILGHRSRFRIAGNWQSAPANVGPSDIIMLYLVSASPKGDDFNIMVPFDCSCIFVQPKIFEDRLSTYSNASPQMLKVDENYALAFMLLHEVGHIEHGDPGKYEDRHKRRDYNFDQTDQKKAESLADKFAADLLVEAADDKMDFKGWIASMNAELAITNMSWNLSVIRHVNNFGASLLCSRLAFADDGYSHPNYELRILAVNDLIAHTSASDELLKNFEDCRARPAAGSLYK
jgi:hypothetical protein